MTQKDIDWQKGTRDRIEITTDRQTLREPKKNCVLPTSTTLYQDKKKVQPKMNRYSLLFFHSVSEFKLRMFIDVEKTDFRIRALQRPFFHFRLYSVCVNDLLRILWLHFTSFAYKSMLWRWQTKWMDIFKSDCRTHTNRMHIHWAHPYSTFNFTFDASFLVPWLRNCEDKI